jgi:hypothetical protein
VTEKLALYNKAAQNLSQERLTALTDDVPLKRELDANYDNILQQAMEMGLWKWSLRSVELNHDPSIDTSDFGGLTYGFTLPDDFVRIANISMSPYFPPTAELDDFEITGPGKTLYTDHDPIYLKYVSNGTSYGLNLAMWPETFAEGVGHMLAASVALNITKSRSDRDEETKEAEKAIAQAKVRDAVDERVKTKPVGRLVRSRFRYHGGNRPLWPTR